MKFSNISPWLDRHRMLSHAGVAALSGLAVWIISAGDDGVSARGGTGSQAGEAEVRHMASGRPPHTTARERASGEKANGVADQKKDTARLKIGTDGSMTIPPDLVSRFFMHPLTIELKPNLKELSLLGISEDGARKLEELVGDLREETIGQESEKFTVFSEDEGQVTLRIPADPSSVEARKERIRRKLQEIAGAGSEVLWNSVDGTLSHLTAGFGAHDTIVHMARQEDGNTTYEMIEVLPESVKTLSGANAPINDYRRVSLNVVSFKSDEVPERLKHLFTTK